MEQDDEKLAHTVRVKAAMDEHLRSLSWVEKVRSIERMNEADRVMKTAMQKTLAEERERAATGESGS